jgi:hypothetical protein
MRNKVYYIKPTNNDLPEAIKLGILKALSIIQDKGYSNIKFVLTGISLLDNPPNLISQAFEKMFAGKGVDFTNQLRTNRGLSFVGFPTEEQTTGINLLLSNNNPNFVDENTVVVLLWADEDSLKKIQSSLSFTQIDLVAVVWNETQILNEFLSASKGTRFPNLADPNVNPYANTFTQPINDILRRLKSINITDPASHTPTRETMKNVIDELKRNRLIVSYVDFLGYLVNEVNFPLKESVELVNWKRRYFGR